MGDFVHKDSREKRGYHATREGRVKRLVRAMLLYVVTCLGVWELLAYEELLVVMD